MKALSWFALLALTGGVAAGDVKKEDVPRLLKDLKSAVAKTRAAAAEDLGHLGAIRADYAKPAVPTLLEMVRKDKDAKAREAAAKAIGRIGVEPADAVPVLIEALKEDKGMLVRIAAARSLGQFGSDAKEAVSTLRDVQEKARGDKSMQRLGQTAGEALRSIRGAK